MLPLLHYFLLCGPLISIASASDPFNLLSAVPLISIAYAPFPFSVSSSCPLWVFDQYILRVGSLYYSQSHPCGPLIASVSAPFIVSSSFPLRAIDQSYASVPCIAAMFLYAGP